MSSFSVTSFAPCGTYWPDGTVTGAHQGQIVSVNASKTNTVKRIKPVNLSLDNATALTHSSWRRESSVLTRSVVVRATPLPKIYGTEVSVVTDHAGLGSWSDSLQYETALRNVVLNDLRSQARQSSANLATMLGEYRQAADLFYQLVKDLHQLTMAVKLRDPRILLYGYYHRSGEIRKGSSGFSWSAKVQKDLSARWLQYVYGVKPLMGDMHDVLVELRNKTNRGAPVIKLRAHATQRNRPAPTLVTSAMDSKLLGERKTWSQKRVQGVAEIKTRNDILNSTLGAYGFTNPLSVAWELTPFSFVVDWWINVGEILGSLDNCLYFDPASKVQITTRYEQSMAIEFGPGGGIYQYKEFGRESPISLGCIPTPRFKTNPSILHIANGLALVRTLLGHGR